MLENKQLSTMIWTCHPENEVTVCKNCNFNYSGVKGGVRGVSNQNQSAPSGVEGGLMIEENKGSNTRRGNGTSI